ncbi:tyrosine protein phosphatase 1 [Exophiala xenobiotica]|nr:tyrosine protein phosphatase 1 [Exophiala xenobiotica]
MAGEEHSVSKGWFCLICEASTDYRTESDLSAHYMKDHAEFITANQMQTLLDSSLLTFSTTPICCPLCDPSEGDPLERRPPDWDHIAEHVHAFALLSLPWGTADPVVQPQALHEACAKVSSWLGSNARPTDSTSEVHALQIGLPNIGNLYFNQEPYFAESKGMRTESSIASIETDRGPEGLGNASPLLFPENDSPIGSDTNLLETVDAFLQIPLADWVACGRFLARHEEIIVLADRDEFLNQAWKALKRADLIRAKACIQRLVLIETCTTLTPEGREHMFTALEQPKSAERKNFYAACEREEDSLRARMERAHASGRSSPTINQASSESASGAKEQDQFGAAMSGESKNDKKESESRATSSTPRWLKKNEKDQGEPVLDPTQSDKEHPSDDSRSRYRQHVSTTDHIKHSVLDLTPKYRPSREKISVEAVTKSIYVVAEYPADTCVSCFWHMIMQQSSGSGAVVVTLGKSKEDRRVRCFPTGTQEPVLMILPDSAGPSEADQAGQPPVLPEAEAASHGSEPPEDRANEHSRYVTIELLSLHYDSVLNCEVQKLELTIDDQSTLVRHYLLPDAQFTKTRNRVALLELMKASRAAAGDSPRVVCCTTNVGLANTWVALDFLRAKLETGSFIIPSRQKETLSEGAADISNHNNDDLIWTTVGRMLEQGRTMDMNESEYKFLYETLKDEFSKLYSEPGEDPPATAERSASESRAHDTPRARRTVAVALRFQTTDTVSIDSRFCAQFKPFFVPGRVFAILLQEPSCAQSISQKTGSNRKDAFEGLTGNELIGHVRRMIVCRQLQGSSLCVPISSYNGKGVAAKPLSYQERRCYAIVYPRGQRAPEGPPGEPNFSKMPIAINLCEDQVLPESSRIDFGEWTTIEYNVHVMDVGRVAAESMANFESHCREELLRR